MGLVTPIAAIDDPRLSPYRNLKDRDLAREGGLFIAEGEMVVRRLLESGVETVSVLAADGKAQRIAAWVGEGVPLYVVAAEKMNGIVGFKFHSGIMAVGRRPPRLTLEQVMPAQGRCLLAVCPEIANTENLGVMVRIAAAFGVRAMVLGERCCDPFYRQAIRVSMGNVFGVPIVQSASLSDDLAQMKERWGIERLATVLGGSAETLRQVRAPARAALLFGNEARGLDGKWLEQCDRRITIPMPPGVDSLNVAVAAGIFLHHFAHSSTAVKD